MKYYSNLASNVGRSKLGSLMLIFFGVEVFSWIVFPLIPFFKIMKMTLLGNSEKTYPPPSPAKKVSEDDVLQAFGLNSAEYTHSCANLAHDEVGGSGSVLAL